MDSNRNDLEQLKVKLNFIKEMTEIIVPIILIIVIIKG